MILTHEELTPLIQKWRERLALNDWSIRVDITDVPFENPAVLAITSADKETQRAVIQFRHDLPSQAVTPLSVESVVIHELLHVRLAHFADYAEHVALNLVGGPLGDEVFDRLHDEGERFVDTVSLALTEWR